MFFAQNEYGLEAFRAAFENLPIESDRRIKATAKFLGIAESTLTAYLAGKSDPPRAVAYALWHESDLGRAVTSAHSERAAYLWRSLAKSQTATIATLRAQVQALTEDNAALRREAAASDGPHLSANDRFYAVG